MSKTQFIFIPPPRQSQNKPVFLLSFLFQYMQHQVTVWVRNLGFTLNSCSTLPSISIIVSHEVLTIFVCLLNQHIFMILVKAAIILIFPQ